MNNKIYKVLNYYCENEMKDFIKNPKFIMIKELAESLSYHVDCCYGREKDYKTNHLYLSLSICSQNGKVIETMDGGLTTSTMIVLVDKKDRIQFFTWKEDNEFIKDLDWIINILSLRKEML